MIYTDRTRSLDIWVPVVPCRTAMTLGPGRVDLKRKVHCRMHVCIDSGYVLYQSVARAGEMDQACLQTRKKFGK